MTLNSSVAELKNAVRDLNEKRIPEVRNAIQQANANASNALLATLLSPPVVYKLRPPLTQTYSEGRLTSITFTGGKVTITYDGANRISTWFNSQDGITGTVTYNTDGTIATITEA